MLASVIVSEVDPTYILAKTVYIKKVLSIIKGLVQKVQSVTLSCNSTHTINISEKQIVILYLTHEYLNPHEALS